jgi:hypothetical protein
MSQNSAQNIPQEATKLRKLAKVTARYMEMEQFKDSDHHTGYFCYNCIYFMKPNHCALVTEEGPDVYDKTSGEIAPHGICALWEPNEKEIHHSTNTTTATSSSQGKSDESTTNVSATFSCEMCNEKFNSREELKQHTVQKHK